MRRRCSILVVQKNIKCKIFRRYATYTYFLFKVALLRSIIYFIFIFLPIFCTYGALFLLK